MTVTLEDELPGSGIYFDDPEQFVVEMPYPAMIKDKSGTYILSNQKCADLFGMRSDEIVGLSVHELDRRVKNKWEEGYGEVIASLDFTVLSKGIIQKDTERILPVYRGFLRVQDTIKYPVLTPITKRVSGVITFSYDKTHEVGIINLFKSYFKIYESRAEAVALFLESVGLKAFFHTLPSIREVETILQIAKSYQYSSAAVKMGVKLKTLDKNILSVKCKMLSPDLFGVMVEMIRNHV